MPFKVRDFVYNRASGLRAWRYRRAGMTIGTGCKISGSAKLDMTNPRGIVIGDNTAVSFRTAILTHDFLNGRHVETRIGSNSFIGAHSVIMPGVKVGDSAVVGAGSVVYSDVPDNAVVSGNPARVVERNIVTGRWGTLKRGAAREATLAARGMAAPALPSAPTPAPAHTPGATSPGDAGTIAKYVPGLDPDVAFVDSGFDSFSMIGLRAQIEQDQGIQIADGDWERVERPRDLLRFVARPNGAAVSTAAAAPAEVALPPVRTGSIQGATATRHYEINMPQMSRSGLSESWLFKEIGDIHWSLITSALGVKSKSIVDQTGNRLYATFTKINYASNQPLSAFVENGEADFDASMTRFGAGMFLSRITLRSADIELTFRVMSSFSKFGEKGNNKSLAKGQPFIPDNFAIPQEVEKPALTTEYAAIRAEPIGTPIWSTQYRIQPIHDINGVGLLYFASYPIINDICMERHVDGRFAISPLSRDVNYFANSGSDDELRFDLTTWEEDGDVIATVSHITRGDGTKMATLRTRYARS